MFKILWRHCIKWNALIKACMFIVYSKVCWTNLNREWKGKRMTAIFYENQTPIKPVHFGAEGYTDYAMQPHDKEKTVYKSS